MQKSESIASLAAALSKAQAELGPAIKDSSNPFYKSKYADLRSVWEAASDPLANNGLAVAQTNRVTEPLPYIDREGKNALLIGVVVETVLMHSSGEWISGECYYPIAKNDAQGVGSAITYGRRYGLQAILGIVADDDDGNAASHKPAGNQYDQRTENEQAKHFGQKPSLPPPATAPAPAPTAPAIDYIGTKVAKKYEVKLREICTKLNKAKVPMLLEGHPEMVWNSENLDKYCLSGFDTALRDLDETDMAVLFADMETQLQERLAIQGESEPAPAGDGINEKQLKALTRLCDLKNQNESKVAEEASGGKKGTFASLTEVEAEAAIKIIQKM